MARLNRGSIQQRGEKSFRISYYDLNHIRQFETITGDVDDAKRELAGRLAEIAKGIPVSSKPNTVLFGELAVDIDTDYKLNKRKSYDDMETRFRLHILPVFGKRKAAQITTSQLSAYVLMRQNQAASNGTINRELELIRHTFKFALDGKRILSMPKVPHLKEHNVRTGFFTREEVERVTSFLPESIASFVWFGFLTGWRYGEIQQLKWSAVDFARGEIRLDPGSTKNGQGRVFPMSVELRELLKIAEVRCIASSTIRTKTGKAITVARLRMPATTQHVFTIAGRPIGAFRKQWKRACYKAGIPCTVEPVKKGGKKGAVKILACSRTFHDLRRSAVREFVKAGMSEGEAMKLSGHLTRSVFDRYNVVSEADLRDAVAKLNGANRRSQTNS